MKYAAAMCLVLCAVSTSAFADPFFVSYVAGAMVDPPAISSPGTPVELSFLPILETYGVDALEDVMDITLGFSTFAPYSSFSVQLSCDSTIHHFTPTAPDPRATAITLYDPAYGAPTGNVESVVMPQSWKDELADGVLSANVWVNGTADPGFAMLQGMATYQVPEPTTVVMLGLAAACVTRRRR